MKTLLLFIFALLTQNVFAQNKIRPVVEIGYGKNLIEGFYASNILQAGAGIKLNEHFYFQVNFMQAKDIRKSIQPNNQNDYYKTDILFFSTSYRVLKDNFIISPIFTLDAGGEVYSNARLKIVRFGGSSIKLYDTYTGHPQLLYNKGKFFGKIKLQADIKLWNFNLLIGGGYSYFRIDVDYLKPEYIGYDLVGYSIDENRLGILNVYGFSLDASLRYTLNFDKNNNLKGI